MTQLLGVVVNRATVYGLTSVEFKENYLQPSEISVRIAKNDDIVVPSIGEFGDEIVAYYDYNFFSEACSARARTFYGFVIKKSETRDEYTVVGRDVRGLLALEYIPSDFVLGEGVPIGVALKQLIRLSTYHESENPLNGRIEIDGVKIGGFSGLTLPAEIAFNGSETILDGVTKVLSIVDANGVHIDMWTEVNTIYIYRRTSPMSNNVIYYREVLSFDLEFDERRKFSKVIAKDSDDNVGEYPKNQRYPYYTKKININTPLGLSTLQSIAKQYYQKYREEDNEPTKISITVHPLHTMRFKPGEEYYIAINKNRVYHKLLYSSSTTFTSSNIRVSLGFGTPKEKIKDLVRNIT